MPPNTVSFNTELRADIDRELAALSRTYEDMQRLARDAGRNVENIHRLLDRMKSRLRTEI